MDYKRAVNLIVSGRRAALSGATEVFERALKENAELLNVEKAIRAADLNEVKSGIKTDTAALERKKIELLSNMGISKSDLIPPPACKKCGDTGFLNGAYCDCVKRLAFGGADNINLPLHNFSESEFSLYENDSAARKIFSDVEKITTLYPDNKKRNIVITGPSGTGKTFLAGCAAKTILERGFSVTAVTAFDFVNRALKYHTTFDDKKMSFLSPLIDCVLLVIDDLGTESILKNITLEYLFMIINERVKNGLLTFITTNLNEQAILSRYGERIYSRLFDRANSYNTNLKGKDIRLKK